MGVRFYAAMFSALLCAPVLHAATIEVAVSNFRYTPNDVTINVGDTVRWTNNGGLHNVRADDGSFSNPVSSSAWTFSRTFTAAGDFAYFCEIHSTAGGDINTSMNGVIRVRSAGPPPLVINQGLGGSWFNPATGGQGFLIDLLPDLNFMFVAWFTYEKALQPSAFLPAPKVGVPEHRWMTASGIYTGNPAVLPLYVSSGGLFDNGKPVTTTAVGTMTLNFTDCSNGTVTYNIPAENLTATVPISRQTTGMAAYCRSLIPASRNASSE